MQASSQNIVSSHCPPVHDSWYLRARGGCGVGWRAGSTSLRHSGGRLEARHWHGGTAGDRGRGPLCTLAAALLHDTRQAGAVECLEEVVNPLALVTARVEARRRGGLELATAALLRSELRVHLVGQLFRLREIMGGSLEVAGDRVRLLWRSREIMYSSEVARKIAGGGGVGEGCGTTESEAGRASSESTVMAAQSTFEAQSFLDHTSAPSSTTTSLATPSAMSTACDGGEGNGRMADSAGTPHSFSLFGVRCAPSVLPELPEPSARVLCVAPRRYSDRHWQQVAPPG